MRDAPPANPALAFLSRFGPLMAITIAFIWASWTIASRRVAEAPADAAVIRIGHWQLEASVREAFDLMGAEFSNSPEVKAKYPQYSKIIVVQDAIPESTYGQWVSCNMIAGTAPDLIEVGQGLPQPIWLGYQTRYFEPLTQMANEPNPFNKGTEFEKVAFRETFDDGMRAGYQEELQDYMRVPLSRFTMRVFYNKTLLKKLANLEEPPRDFRGFMATCKAIGSKVNPQGDHYIPIVSSAYHTPMWETGLALPLTFELIYKADFNRDGTLGNDELFAAVKSGRLSFKEPAIAARYKIIQDVKANFQTGFAALNRDDGVFAFAQQRAVFITTGTWDVGSLVEQAKEEGFEVGIMSYPQPAKDDPEYGQFIRGPVFDPAGQGFPVGLTRFSKHPDIAKDFLYFLGSKRGNQKLNDTIGWIPSISGTKLPTALAKFAPVNQGMYPNFNQDLGGETVKRYQQLNSLFANQADYTYDKLLSDFEPFYKKQGLEDWKEAQRDWRRAIINNEKFLAGLRGQALLSEGSTADAQWLKYRTYVANRQVNPGISQHVKEAIVVKGELDPVSPYEYRPEALENLRRQLASPATEPPH